MNQNIHIRSANMLTEQEHLAQSLSRISQEHPAMLYRTTQFYSDLLAQNLIVVAFDDETHEIIGSGCLFPLAENFAEISCIHVDTKYSGRGIGSTIVRELRRIWQEANLQLLLTMKPSVSWSEGMIIDAVKNNLVPVPFSYLESTPEAYHNCCCCDSNNPETGCPYRDTTCILWVELHQTSYDISRQHISTSEFHQAIPNIQVRNRIINGVHENIQNFLDR